MCQEEVYNTSWNSKAHIKIYNNFQLSNTPSVWSSTFYPTYLHINLAWTIVWFGILDVHLHDTNNLWLVQESWHHDNRSIHHPLPISNFHDTNLFIWCQISHCCKILENVCHKFNDFFDFGISPPKNQGFFFPEDPSLGFYL
jgi:hypothetical protein